MNSQQQSRFNRRNFIGAISTGAAALGITMYSSPLASATEKVRSLAAPDDPDEWFNQIKGNHRIVFDVTEPFKQQMLPFAWPRVFLITNEATGTSGKDCSAVVVLRHEAIPYAMEDRLWEKYKFGEVFNIEDSETKSPAVRNAFWQPKPGAFKVPGVGEVAIGINELQDSGVMFCVCDVALTVNSAAVAQSINQDPAEVKKDWVAGILPGIQVVPSGIWAVNRAQEHGCSYCFG